MVASMVATMMGGFFAMSLLLATGLRKIFAGVEILRGTDLRIEAGEKVGIVGRNGGGKTTLLRILEGQESPDDGSLVLAKGARLAYVPQRPAFEPGVSVLSYVETGLAEATRTAAEYERVGEELGHAEEADLERLVEEHSRLAERMEFLGAWESERRVETVLSGIGLPRLLWERDASTLSGGEKSRTALARELVSVPDLLLLDEPTNHLDLNGIEWLEDYLAQLGSAVLIVSHDRRLLDRAVGFICELEFGSITRYPGSYSAYVDLKEERYATDFRAWKQQTEELKKEEAFIKRHMGTQRTAEAKGRLKRMQRVERLEKPHHDVRRPVIRMAATERGGEMVLEAEGIVIRFGERTILKGADVRIGRGERIGIVGPNGTGKTSLLKVLAGRVAPTAGEISRGHKAHCGYFDQETSELRPDQTPYQTMRLDHPQMTDQEIRDHLARFLFRGDGIEALISTLSGGERSRLALARLVLSKPSWMALDEPTNHLDLAARTALEEMLGEFDGALVCVSHDRAFLDGLCTTILEVRDGEVTRYRGNYTEYRAQLARADQEAETQKLAAKKRRKEQAKKAPKPQAQPARKKPKANPYRLKKIEAGIIELEEEKETLTEELGSEAVYRDPEALRDRQMRLAEIERDLDDLNREWEQFT